MTSPEYTREGTAGAGFERYRKDYTKLDYDSIIICLREFFLATKEVCASNTTLLCGV
ncbi:hypothetical protein sS8_4434 [Methylocaldum marinum]|uniref:Uncharacterized protein n=1 Tax=Methylocaldum marinum TaxID=1432792 RepID=A0A250KXY0_9GAMM|nr:hypothetical protein sS8_4434 [Methylocaldum marinum]